MDEETVKQTIKELLERLTISVERIDVEVGNGQTLYHIHTKDSGLLIGMNGENLRAVNVILKKIIERRANAPEAKQFLIDVNGYHSHRIVELQRTARMLGERAKVFKYDVEMSPMNSYERRIIHSLFANDREISTESVGEGKVRRVVLKYTNNKSPIASDRQRTTEKDPR